MPLTTRLAILLGAAASAWAQLGMPSRPLPAMDCASGRRVFVEIAPIQDPSVAGIVKTNWLSALDAFPLQEIGAPASVKTTGQTESFKKGVSKTLAAIPIQTEWAARVKQAFHGQCEPVFLTSEERKNQPMRPSDRLIGVSIYF